MVFVDGFGFVSVEGKIEFVYVYLLFWVLYMIIGDGGLW